MRLPVHDRRPPPVESGNELLEDKQKITLHQAHWDCIANGFKNAQLGRLCHRLLTALSFLLCLECCVGLRHLPLREMHRAVGTGAHLLRGALPFTVGDNGLGSVTAALELRTLRVLFRLRFVVADGDKLPARDNRTALLRLGAGGADLHQTGLSAITGHGVIILKTAVDAILGPSSAVLRLH